MTLSRFFALALPAVAIAYAVSHVLNMALVQVGQVLAR